MSSVEDSAHGSVSTLEHSAHRSSESAHRSAAGGEVEKTLAVEKILLAPVIEETSTAWWTLRRRHVMTVRGHRPGRTRVRRFFTRRGLERAHAAYLAAHRRVYRYWYSHVPIT